MQRKWWNGGFKTFYLITLHPNDCSHWSPPSHVNPKLSPAASSSSESWIPRGGGTISPRAYNTFLTRRPGGFLTRWLCHLNWPLAMWRNSSSHRWLGFPCYLYIWTIPKHWATVIWKWNLIFTLLTLFWVNNAAKSSCQLLSEGSKTNITDWKRTPPRLLILCVTTSDSLIQSRPIL